MNIIKRLTHAVILVLAVASLIVSASCCNGNKIKIHRFDKALASGEYPDDQAEIDAGNVLFDAYDIDLFDGYSIAVYSQKNSVKAHVHAVDSVFGGGMGSEERVLGKAFSRLAVELPGVTIPEVFAIITPYAQSVLVADTMVFVGLNHYLGADYEPYGYFPEYLRGLKTRQRLPIDVVEAIVRTSYVDHGRELPTTLDRMIYDGALTELLCRTLDITEQDALGFNDKQMEWLDSNEHNIWQTIVEKQLLYSSDPSVGRALLEPSPSTFIINASAPGRAGRITAHRIVKAYLESHPEVSIEDLLSGKVKGDAEFIAGSNYRP